MLETVLFLANAGPTRCNVADYTPDMGPLCDDTGAPAVADGITPPPVAPAVADGITLPPVAPAVADGITLPPVAPAVADGITPPPVAPAVADGITLPPVAPVLYLVNKTGKKFFVIQANGERVTDVAAIDVDGYKTDVDAWAAINSL